MGEEAGISGKGSSLGETMRSSDIFLVYKRLASNICEVSSQAGPEPYRVKKAVYDEQVPPLVDCQQGSRELLVVSWGVISAIV